MIRHYTTDGRERGVSVAITHVLTIGITTILIAMLMMSGSALLESETERSADTALETIGERLAGEIENVDQIANDDETESVTLTVDHPRTASSTGYTVELFDECGNPDAAESPLVDDDLPCLELTTHDNSVVVHVPVIIDAEDLEGSASGGTIKIIAEEEPDPSDDVTISIEGAN